MIPSKRKVGKHLFKAVLSKNRSFHSDHFNLKISNIGKNKAKFSVVVSKKVEKTAVNRNLTKRRVYGVCRPLIKDVVSGTVGVFFVKKSVVGIPFNDLELEVKNLISKTGIISKITL